MFNLIPGWPIFCFGILKDQSLQKQNCELKKPGHSFFAKQSLV